MKYIEALAAAVILALLAACGPQPKPWGHEGGRLLLPGTKVQIWAVAPALNISGVSQVDALLQSDLLFGELQQVEGLTVLPVNRVAEVYHSLKIEKVQSEDQAIQVCELLGCDALVVPTITAYDAYDPPKVGASLQAFFKPTSSVKTATLDVHALERSATDAPSSYPTMPAAHHLIQAVGMYDAEDGTVRREALAYAFGRTDPNGPMGERIVFQSMDHYCGFVYHDLIGQLLAELAAGQYTDLPQTRPSGSAKP